MALVPRGVAPFMELPLTMHVWSYGLQANGRTMDKIVKPSGVEFGVLDLIRLPTSSITLISWLCWEADTGGSIPPGAVSLKKGVNTCQLTRLVC